MVGLELRSFWLAKGLLVAAAVVVLAVVMVLAAVSTVIHKGLLRRRNQVDDAWTQVDVQLRRRSDLIPSLVERPMAMPGMSGGPWRR